MSPPRSTRTLRLLRRDDVDDAPAHWMTPREIADALAAGRPVPDGAFDRYLPEALRRLSALHWTPLAVAAHAARWLHARGVRTVLDVGAGAGKFSVVAALAAELRVTGLEQRARLVDVARSLARLYRVAERVTFVQGVHVDGPLPSVDAYYLFNPFGENLLNTDEHIDHDVELSDPRYVDDVAAMEQRLRDAPRGTHVMTYNGFGGAVPDTYDEVRPSDDAPNRLSLWRRVR
ncbi:MAG: class I SAM-dependent methyltransferase [Polyangiales bacterium]